MYRSPPLEIKELMALYGSERHSYSAGDEDGTSEDYDLDSESSEEAKAGRGIRSSVSLEIYGLQRGQHVHFSNQEYYRRLEELKSAHLRNMAELEKMYISQDGERRGGKNREARQSVSGAARKLQRINSQEELDFHETSSGSDQSELCGEDSLGEPELDDPRRIGQDRTFTSDILLGPDQRTTQKRFRFQPRSTRPQPQSGLSRQAGVRVWSSSKVTVPRPFNMMLREEERKKRRVRTRSEVELENTLLRRELEELRECQKQFRASPAPAHTRLPLYEVISCRPSQRPDRSRSKRNTCGTRSVRTSAAAPPQPFHFLERERKKREAKIVAELGLGHREERQAFRARPMPSSVYGERHRAGSKTAQQSPTMCSLEREATEGHSDPNSDLEPDALPTQTDASPDSRGPRRCPCTKPVKKQIELSIEMVQERDWCGVNPTQSP